MEDNETKKSNVDQSIRKRFVTLKQAAALYSLGLNKIQEHAKKAGAFYKLDGKVLINIEIFDAYLEQFRIPGDFEDYTVNLVPDLAGLYQKGMKKVTIRR